MACTAIGYWLIFRLGRATPIMLAVGVATVLTWYVNEFGAVPAVVAFVTAIYFWKKGKTVFSDRNTYLVVTRVSPYSVINGGDGWT
jgi:hypothetical protein